MTLTTTAFDSQRSIGRGVPRKGPMIDMTHWGYVVRKPAAQGIVHLFGTAISRFVGTLSLLIAAGFLLLPDGAQGEGVGAMKLGAMAMFTAIGLFLFLFGRQGGYPELHVDTLRGEVRVGSRGIKGKVRFSAILKFEDIASVYLLRSKTHNQPTRLFLRLKDFDGAIEVACGPEDALEELRQRVSRDLARDPRLPEAVSVPGRQPRAAA